MNPKKAKSYINIISKDLNEDVDLLECLIDFYYKECRNALSNLKYNRLLSLHTICGIRNFKNNNMSLKKC